MLAYGTMVERALDEETVQACAERYPVIFTAEEHSLR